MNPTIQTILTRRSCRSFQKKSVPKKIVEVLLDCALSAPSGMNLQTWQFTALLDPKKIQMLAKAVRMALSRPETYDMYDPPVLIITSNEKGSRFCAVDNACAMENIHLACHSLGLGCVWINQVGDCFDHPEVRKLLQQWGIPQNHGVYGCAAIGYKDGEPQEKTIKAVAQIIE